MSLFNFYNQIDYVPYGLAGVVLIFFVFVLVAVLGRDK